MEVILEDCKKHPHCPHGPCLMFERYSSTGKKTGRRFFACSACRDRSDCSFFQWVDDDLSLQTKEHWKTMIEKSKPPFCHKEYFERLKAVKELPTEKWKYCKTCSLLLLPGEDSHLKHKVVTSLTLQDILRPSSLFETLQNKKAEAQYFFTQETLKFVATLLQTLGFSKLVLIGVPKLFEYIAQNKSEFSEISTFLMDIDYRYMQFLNPDQFCHYNIFNNYFFGGKECKKRLKNFLTEQNGDKVAIILDPPFGGLVDAISYTLKTINKWWQTKNGRNSEENAPLLWFFPYFMEGRIVKSLPDVMMMDYKVDYTNHKKFGKKVSLKGRSPVRIYTNIKASTFVLPEHLGYRLCEKCQRYVSEENIHCLKCNLCTTKHGKTYKHCDKCKQCVKSTYEHCVTCDKCNLIRHICPDSTNAVERMKTLPKQNYERCNNCSGLGHRKRNCPVSISK